jgi:NCS1 family nucleobase:cation symporter-1
MYSMDTTRRYWFRNGYNPNAVASVLLGGVPAIVLVLVGGVVWSGSSNAILSHAGDFSWFVGCALGFVAFTLLERVNPRIAHLDRDVEMATSGVGR